LSGGEKLFFVKLSGFAIGRMSIAMKSAALDETDRVSWHAPFANGSECLDDF